MESSETSSHCRRIRLLLASARVCAESLDGSSNSSSSSSPGGGSESSLCSYLESALSLPARLLRQSPLPVPALPSICPMAAETMSQVHRKTGSVLTLHQTLPWQFPPIASDWGLPPVPGARKRRRSLSETAVIANDDVLNLQAALLFACESLLEMLSRAGVIRYLLEDEEREARGRDGSSSLILSLLKALCPLAAPMTPWSSSASGNRLRTAASSCLCLLGRIRASRKNGRVAEVKEPSQTKIGNMSNRSTLHEAADSLPTPIAASDSSPSALPSDNTDTASSCSSDLTSEITKSKANNNSSSSVGSDAESSSTDSHGFSPCDQVDTCCQHTTDLFASHHMSLLRWSEALTKDGAWRTPAHAYSPYTTLLIIACLAGRPAVWQPESVALALPPIFRLLDDVGGGAKRRAPRFPCGSGLLAQCSYCEAYPRPTWPLGLPSSKRCYGAQPLCAK
jgi:hypothetical protein